MLLIISKFLRGAITISDSSEEILTTSGEIVRFENIYSLNENIKIDAFRKYLHAWEKKKKRKKNAIKCIQIQLKIQWIIFQRNVIWREIFPEKKKTPQEFSILLFLLLVKKKKKIASVEKKNCTYVYINLSKCKFDPTLDFLFTSHKISFQFE